MLSEVSWKRFVYSLTVALLSPERRSQEKGTWAYQKLACSLCCLAAQASGSEKRSTSLFAVEDSCVQTEKEALPNLPAKEDVRRLLK